MEYSLYPLGDTAVLIELADAAGEPAERKVSAVVNRLSAVRPPWMIEYIRAYTTVTVVYAPDRCSGPFPFAFISGEIESMLTDVREQPAQSGQTVEIPVVYGGTYGPDLSFVAEHNGLTKEDVIRIHSSGNYRVHMIGFAPGFPFIGGMPKEIAAPRKETPRLHIPARSVGIAGAQTGIYPIVSPGGWQLIGRTPADLFLPEGNPPSLLSAGDRVRFVPISAADYEDMRGGRE